MSSKKLLSFAFVLALAFVPVHHAHAYNPFSIFSDASSEMEIFDLVNRERSKLRLPNLEWDSDVARIARAYSRRMARDGFFDHIDPDGNSAIERAENAKLKGWSKIGENLFACDPIDSFSAIAVRGWMRSPTHKENMLDRNWTATGIGIAKARDGSIYITELFIEP
jgi:uncharacterized protein YkwD